MKYLKRINEYLNHPINEGDVVTYRNSTPNSPAYNTKRILKVRKIVDNMFTAEGCYGVFFDKSNVIKVGQKGSRFDCNFVSQNEQKWRKVYKIELGRIEQTIQRLVKDLPYKEGDRFNYKDQEARILNYRWGENHYNIIINGGVEIVKTETLREIKSGNYVKESIDTITEYELHVNKGYSQLKKGIGENLLDLGKITDVSKTDLSNIKVTYKDCNVITQDGHYWLQIKGDCKCDDKKN